MTDAIFHWSMKLPIVKTEQKRQRFRAFQQDQGFITKGIDTEVPERFILAQLHFGYYNELTFRAEYSTMSARLHKDGLCAWTDRV